MRAVSFLVVPLMAALGIHHAATAAYKSAHDTQRVWKQARALLWATGCSICGRHAQYDVSRLKKEGGRVVGKIHVGYRCAEHRDAESIAIESGLCTARMLDCLALLLAVLAIARSVRPIAKAEPHGLWRHERVRPARRRSLVLASTIWVGVSGYVLAVGFKAAYLTLPLWMGVGGMLCLWMHELLCGGSYLRCGSCSFEGNLHDVRHCAGACPGCGADRFDAQELLVADRKIARTTYRYRMLIGVTLAQLDELDRAGRIWKEPRGAWRPAPVELAAA
jgi:hypothetical protein